MRKAFLLCLCMCSLSCNVFIDEHAVSDKEPDVLIRNYPINGFVPGEKSLQEVEDAILAGCKNKGWSARVFDDGIVMASIVVRGHSAYAKITFDTETYLIRAAKGTNCGGGHYSRWAGYLSSSITEALQSDSLSATVNIEDSMIPVKLDGSDYTLDEVRTAIIRACHERGWAATPKENNTIHATILVRGVSAAVDVPYNEDSFSILYVESSGRSHDRYFNRWANNLQRSIVKELGVNAKGF